MIAFTPLQLRDPQRCVHLGDTVCTFSLTYIPNAVLPVLCVKSQWNLIYLLLFKRLRFNRTGVWLRWKQMEHVQTQQAMQDNICTRGHNWISTACDEIRQEGLPRLSRPQLVTDEIHQRVSMKEMQEDGSTPLLAIPISLKCCHVKNCPLKGKRSWVKTEFTLFFFVERSQAILVIFRSHSLCIQDASS